MIWCQISKLLLMSVDWYSTVRQVSWWAVRLVLRHHRALRRRLLFRSASCQHCRWWAAVVVFSPSSFHVLLFYFVLLNKKQSKTVNRTNIFAVYLVADRTSVFVYSCITAYFVLSSSSCSISTLMLLSPPFSIISIWISLTEWVSLIIVKRCRQITYTEI